MDCDGNYVIKNSWGTSWGQSGFATIDVNNDCGLSAYVYSVLYARYIAATLVLLLAFLL